MVRVSGVALGLLAALSWGIADFLARFASRAFGAYRAQFYSTFVGLAALTVALLTTGEFSRFGAYDSPSAWTWAVVCAALISVASLAFFQAFGQGVLALVSPIVASYGAVTALLAWWSGESLTVRTGIGLACVLVGIVLSAIPGRAAPGEPKSAGSAWLSPGVIWAVCAAWVYGIAFYLLGAHVTPDLGGLTSIWISRLLGPFALAFIARAANEPLGPVPRGRAGWALVGVGGLATLASVATAFGLGRGEDAVVTVLGSMSTVVTVLLALVVLRERLARHQWLGALVTLAGILLVEG
ncbi:DMT family transporter [Deinococcus yavapaiensis]|uniref:Putative membrane protein n=1 Tax=Deinococcus yavapaiensis KR-236 TaxID=694435 RepID=A0A318S235_9DEIO|nr:EamA family transporter [Deinococcus yavapaiensis]PYE49429.1 putative membrane protein [Deinococcus yavapaiensis KR-236]